ncbi:MAG: leucine-rich repeat domain-containing protein [Clostridia bacterium]|nr:leucine-rich repeat domain-containing protein [Clostridia bacterium]
MKITWTKTMTFLLIGLLLVSATACNKNKEETPDAGSEQTTSMLQGGYDQNPGNQYNDPNNQGNGGNQYAPNDQNNQNNQNPPNGYEQQTQPVVNVPDQGGQNYNPSNQGNQGGNQGNSTDSTGLTFTSNGNGTCTLTGMGSCRDICVVIPATSPTGDKVTAIGAQAFYNCTSITVVQIPASITQIGHLAFGGCTGLVYVTVSAGNYSYKDIGGVLYTSDAKTLVHYPAGSGSSSVSIPASVNKIEDMAFYGCKSLKSIRYGGTQDAWSRIAVGSMNYSLNAASVTCQDSGK